MSGERLPVFVDCDNTMGLRHQEIDDGLTLLYLLGRQDVELVGVSATRGNGTAAEAYEQTCALFTRLGVDVPIYTSAEAADALSCASRDYQGLTVLGLGALTNLSRADEIDPGFYERLAQIVVMGGYLRPLRFPRRPVNELNFSSDAPAAYSVLNAPCPVTVMSAHFCLSARFGLSDLAFRASPSWLRRMVRAWFLAFSWHTGAPGFYLWDLVPAAAVGPGAWEPLAGQPPLMSVESTVDDLKSGRLRVRPALGTSGTPGVIGLPNHRFPRRKFVSHCVRRWNAGAGTTSAANPL